MARLLSWSQTHMAANIATALSRAPPIGIVWLDINPVTSDLQGFSMRRGEQKPNLAPLLDHLMEPVARQARRRAAEAIRKAS